jgi:hypothetical protein
MDFVVAGGVVFVFVFVFVANSIHLMFFMCVCVCCVMMCSTELASRKGKDQQTLATVSKRMQKGARKAL